MFMIYLIVSASADDSQCATPKPRKNDQSFNHSSGHLVPGTPPTHGAHAGAGGGQAHEDFEMGSPTWNRTSASPVSIRFFFRL